MISLLVSVAILARARSTFSNARTALHATFSTVSCRCCFAMATFRPSMDEMRVLRLMRFAQRTDVFEAEHVPVDYRPFSGVSHVLSTGPFQGTEHTFQGGPRREPELKEEIVVSQGDIDRGLRAAELMAAESGGVVMAVWPSAAEPVLVDVEEFGGVIAAGSEMVDSDDDPLVNLIEGKIEADFIAALGGEELEPIDAFHDNPEAVLRPPMASFMDQMIELEEDPRNNLGHKIHKNVDQIIDIVQCVQSAEMKLAGNWFTSAYAAQARGLASEFMMMSQCLREQLDNAANTNKNFIEVDALATFADHQHLETVAKWNELKAKVSGFLGDDELPDSSWTDECDSIDKLEGSLFKKRRCATKGAMFSIKTQATTETKKRKRKGNT